MFREKYQWTRHAAHALKGIHLNISYKYLYITRSGGGERQATAAQKQQQNLFRRGPHHYTWPELGLSTAAVPGMLPLQLQREMAELSLVLRSKLNSVCLYD